MEAIRYYSDEQVCIDTVASLRWPDGKPVCPKCGKAEIGPRKHYWISTQKRWKCYSCRKQFSVKVDSIFEDSPLGLDKWLVALWMLCNCKNGVSSHEIARELNIAQKSAWHLLHRLRHVLAGNDSSKLGGEGSVIEADEAFVGGEPANMHLDKRIKRQRMTLNANNEWVKREADTRRHAKVPVMGMIDRKTRQVRAQVLLHLDRKVLQEMILQNVSKGTTVYTDGFSGYRNLAALGFVHETVNHIDEYVRGQVHTQGIENFWSLLKRGLRGTYVAVEPFHLDRYVAEQCWRYNNRSTKEKTITNEDRFVKALSQVAGKRLQWKTLTGKEGGSDAQEF